MKICVSRGIQSADQKFRSVPSGDTPPSLPILYPLLGFLVGQEFINKQTVIVWFQKIVIPLLMVHVKLNQNFWRGVEVGSNQIKTLRGVKIFSGRDLNDLPFSLSWLAAWKLSLQLTDLVMLFIQRCKLHAVMEVHVSVKDNIIGIGLELACNGGPCRKISLKRDKFNLFLKRLPALASLASQFQDSSHQPQLQASSSPLPRIQILINRFFS